ncbi:uncharacterized protein PG998_013142 [Apiospora kogelbergensis]|uniref:uncharacterized protein n=1 Tax=Apiospora kogelbergensis TaxID=1337665 RepID=UPI003130EE84
MIGLLPAIVIGAGLVWCQQQQPFLQLEDVEETATDFSANPVWRIGEVQTIRWTTTSVGCTISLWQQNLKSGSALEGPPIFHSRSATGPTQFDWTPQIFDFDLSESNVFFLQLRHGNGAPDVPSLRSHYVNLSMALSPPPLRLRALSAPTEVDDSIPTIPRPVAEARGAPADVHHRGHQQHGDARPAVDGGQGRDRGGRGGRGLALVIAGVVLTVRRARRRDGAVRMSTLKELPTTPPPRIPTAVVGGAPYSPSYSQFYQMKGAYPPSNVKSHQQVTISETSLGYHPTKVAEMG